MSLFDSHLKKTTAGQDLSADEMEQALDAVVAGSIPEEKIISFLIALRDKGETASEILGAVRALRRKSLKLPIKNAHVIDTCGTGGDGKGTFNISTAAAFVVAGAGVAVAKHGNRAVSSQSGSADVLKACGVNVEASADVVARCVDEIGVGFMMAPLYHPAMKAVAAARQKIGTKTIFNILGPLLNPAQAQRQVIGVYQARLLPLVASVLKETGSQRAAVVHGQDGLDEVTLTGTSSIFQLKGGSIQEEIFDPRSIGYDYCRPEDLVGADAATNAKRLKRVLKGHSEPVDHCVHLNAALAILVAGKTDEFKDALLMAQESISSGKAYEKLEALIEMTNQK